MDSHITEVSTIILNFISKPWAVVTAIILALTPYFPVIKQINKYSTYSDFDALFIPKHEALTRKFVRSLGTIIFIVLAYLLMGILVTFALSFLYQLISKQEISNMIMIVILFLYCLTSIPMLINFVIMGLKPTNKIRKTHDKIKEMKIFSVNFYINYTLSIIFQGAMTFAFIVPGDTDLSSWFSVLFHPIFLLFLYRYYFNSSANKINYKVQTITKQEFNNSNTIMQYTLDQDRLVFKSENSEDESYYLLDRSNETFYKYSPVQE
ncbi:hypothetical protein NiCM35_07730 [Niallia circulans]|uniref:hypothetical protein n=1 Tax=Niallia circulans TaxID=1397 RepID=UPI003D9764AB